MIDRTNVAALIPSYFEGRRIQDVARRVRAQLEHVLVVDDGSTDATASEAAAAGVEVIRHEQNAGKGAAIKTGLRALLQRPALRYILVLDGDGQHLPEEIPRFIDAANALPTGLYVGNRMTDTRTMPTIRRWTNQSMSWSISRLCEQPIPDTQCGYRMISVELAPALFTESNHYDYETEMLVIAARAGHRIGAVPVSTVYGDEKSKIHPVRDTVRFLRMMRRFRKR